MRNVLEIATDDDSGTLKAVLHGRDGATPIAPLPKVNAESLTALKAFASSQGLDIIASRPASKHCSHELIAAGFQQSGRDRFTWTHPSHRTETL